MGSQNSTNNIGFPKTISIQPFHTPVSSVGTWIITGGGTIKNFNFQNQPGSAQNDEINWDVVLGPGTWTIEVLGHTATDAAIQTIQLDGSTVGTVGWYASPGVNNVSKSLTGVVVSTGGKKRLKFLASTRDGSSSAWTMRFTGIYLRRTGD